ncbi:helix-turn-helix transcriptional regulator [Salinispora tropica]|uniref:Regulatory protein, LuxR n=1 Tax=Salinispora tropica (strain ATCC BAA-916 / DSM 44818 / JCM 13857 / NBRC 105044 / CNB-440) TaxID=369723 RepID=A4X8K3_SALTO|nr:AAA family ATPase [Salinispora tropica]ABP55203.1 regulatory protein, LuxR [Salinispora tropica CNB-440]
MGFVERSRELDILRDLYAVCATGRGRVALISGPGATGKTELLRAVADHVDTAGGLVLSAACSRAERMLPAAAMGQLFNSVPLPTEVMRRIGAFIDLGAATTEGDADIRAVHVMCVELLDIARERPLVLLVDDVEFADETTLRTLLYLQRRLTAAQILVVLAESPQPQPFNPEFRAELTRQACFCNIQLSPLSEAGVAEVLRGWTDDETALVLAPAYHRISGGNPLLLHALGEDRRAAGPTDATEAIVGDQFRQAVLACLRRWDPAILETAHGLALLDDFATPTLLARLLDSRPARVQWVLNALTMSGLLDSGRFRHPAARAAVLHDLDPDALSKMHARAAELLHSEGAPAPAIGGHLLAAGGLAEPWAIALLQDAATHALAEDRVDDAVESLKLAHEMCHDAPRRAALTAMLADCQWRVSPAAVSQHLQSQRNALRAGHLSERHAAGLLRYQLWHGHLEDAQETLRHLREARHQLDATTAAEVDGCADWLRLYFPVAFAGRGAAPGATPALTLARTDGSFGWVTPSLTAVLTEGVTDEVIARAEQALGSHMLVDVGPESALCALQTLVYAGRTDQAVHWCDVLGAEAGSRGANTWHAILSDVRSHIALRQGDLPLGERFAHEALDAMSPHNWGVAIGSPLSNMLLAKIGMDKLDEAKALLRYVIPDAMRDTWFWPLYLRARGHLHLAGGRVHAALADFETCGQLATEWGMDLPTLLPWRGDLAQVYLRSGRPDMARKIVTEQLSRPDAQNARTRGISLRLLGSALDVKQRVNTLRQAANLLQESGDRFQLALALTALSRAHYGRGEFNTSRVVARSATQLAKDIQAQALCRRLLPSGEAAGDDEADAPPEHEEMSRLSDAEQRVATLAALGHTNREIGKKLYITVSTVEQHLTRVYRKLNVRRRTELSLGLPMDSAGAGLLAVAPSSAERPWPQWDSAAIQAS